MEIVSVWLVERLVDIAGYVVAMAVAGMIARFFYVPQIKEMKEEIAELKRQNTVTTANTPPQSVVSDAEDNNQRGITQSTPIAVSPDQPVRAALELACGLVSPTDAQLSGALVQLLGTVDNVTDNGCIKLNRQNNERISVWPEEQNIDNLRRGERIKVVGTVKGLSRFDDVDMLNVKNARIESPS